jgi:hypothetical protein
LNLKRIRLLTNHPRRVAAGADRAEIVIFPGGSWRCRNGIRRLALPQRVCVISGVGIARRVSTRLVCEWFARRDFSSLMKNWAEQEEPQITGSKYIWLRVIARAAGWAGQHCL